MQKRKYGIHKKKKMAIRLSLLFFCFFSAWKKIIRRRLALKTVSTENIDYMLWCYRHNMTGHVNTLRSLSGA